jgi:hypothetical protein
LQSLEAASRNATSAEADLRARLKDVSSENSQLRVEAAAASAAAPEVTALVLLR